MVPQSDPSSFPDILTYSITGALSDTGSQLFESVLAQQSKQQYAQQQPPSVSSSAAPNSTVDPLLYSQIHRMIVDSEKRMTAAMEKRMTALEHKVHSRSCIHVVVTHSHDRSTHSTILSV